ncbi:MAG: MgtC/SapB family protein [Candidatus Pacebacteria bacterium]|nr:MgtC/SapB family protein [Candidatus Paceibacterota bacterium]
MITGPALLIDPTAVMFVKLMLALFLGGIIGTERALFARQPAGMRTFGLVAMSACLFILITNYVDSVYLGVVNIQPLQLAPGIVTGIGFIGAGLIIFRGDTVHGVTTAACLWIATAIGMAVGFGMYSVSVFSALLTLIVLTGMWYIENRFKHWFAAHEGSIESDFERQNGGSGILTR